MLSRYLPSGVLYVTPLGMVYDERVTDWRNGLERMRAGRPRRDLVPLLHRLGPGGGSCSSRRSPTGRCRRRRGSGRSAADARVAQGAPRATRGLREIEAPRKGRSSTCAARCAPRSSRSDERQRASSVKTAQVLRAVCR